MSERWRDDIRTLRQRKLVFWAVVLSVLIHLAILVFVFAVPLSPSPAVQKKDTVWLDLDEWRESPPSDGEVMTSPLPANERPPSTARRLAAQNNTTEMETHRADIPINENQADVGPRTKTPSRSPSRPSKKYAIPKVGESMSPRSIPEKSPSESGPGDMTKSADKSAEPNNSIKDLVGSVGYESVASAPGGGKAGGGGNLSPYNPDVGQAGSAINLNTKDFKYVGYFAGLKEKIEWAWVYPQEAQMSGQQGTLTLTFRILRSGELAEVKRVRSSGFPLLDDAAVRAVRDAAAFAPFPDNWPDADITIVANFTYHLVGVKSVF